MSIVFDCYSENLSGVLNLWNGQQKKRGLILRLSFLRYRQTPKQPKQVKAHAYGVSINFYPWLFSIKFGDFQKNKNKANAFYVNMSLRVLLHRLKKLNQEYSDAKIIYFLYFNKKTLFQSLHHKALPYCLGINVQTHSDKHLAN